MGFNKRFLKKENILKNLHHIMIYLDADAIICTDEFSKKVYQEFQNNPNEKDIIDFINKTK
jgi:hypothetical protein